jgi:hypothetical protein
VGRPSSPTSAPTRGRFRPGPGSRCHTAGRSYAPDPAAVGTVVSQAVDSQPRSPVRAPTTNDTHPTTTTSTADAQSGSGAARSTKLRRALHPLTTSVRNSKPGVGGAFPPLSLRPTRGCARPAGTGGDAEGRRKLSTGRLCTSRPIIGTGSGWEGTREVTAVRPVKSPALPKQVRIVSLPHYP